jgi:hypothetical protein
VEHEDAMISASVLQRNELTEDNVRSLAYVVEHGEIYPRVRRVLETIARLLDKADEYDDNDALGMAAACRADARDILAEVLR